MGQETLDRDELSQGETELQSDAIRDQLRKDVASWREGRADVSARQATDLSVAVAKPVPAPRAKRVKPASAMAEPDAAKKKPFGMSYDGSSNADYINYMISRGAR